METDDSNQLRGKRRTLIYLKCASWFDNMRHSPTFQELVNKVRLP